MHECLLCKRDMKVSNDVFGNGCVRNIYSFSDLNMRKNRKQYEKSSFKAMQYAFWQTVNKYGKNCNEFIFNSSEDDSFPMNFNYNICSFSNISIVSNRMEFFC